MYLVDIGGGFPGEKGTSIYQYATIINSSLKKHFPEPQIKIISEPGRFYASSASLLACMVISKKKINIVDQQTNIPKQHNVYYLNDGMHGSFSIFGMHKIDKLPITLRDTNKKEKLNGSTIFGPTCDAKDKVCYNKISLVSS